MRVFYINSRLLTNFYIIINLKFLLSLIYLFKVNETIQFNSSLFHEVSICAFFFFFQYGLRLWKKMDFFIFPDFGQEGLFGFYKLIVFDYVRQFFEYVFVLKEHIDFLVKFFNVQKYCKRKKCFSFFFL